MKEELKKQGELPDNAFRPLKPGETYTPLIPDAAQPKEVTVWSVAWGILMAVIFSAAAAYLGLKVGQVFEAAIPIAIIAVGLSSATKRKNALLENVMIQSIGASSGVIVAGAIFTLPAIYILQAKYPEISVSFFQVFMSSLLGGILGILLLIPFRKYFVKEKHGEFPFPEATATTQVLVSGEKGGSKPNLSSSQVLSVVFMTLPYRHLVGGTRSSAVEFYPLAKRCRQGKSGLQAQHGSCSPRARLHYRVEICGNHLCGLVPCLVDHRPRYVSHL